MAMDGVVKLLLVLAAVVSNAAPPDEAAYHRNVPEVDEVAFKVTVPVPQRAASVVVGCGGTVVIVAVTAARLLTHVPLSNST
jgi:hypothetical protein